MGAGRELYARTRGGEEIPVEIGLNPIRRADKAGALATVIDISERKRLERHQAILVQEIQHRAGNLLAVVQALAMRSFTADRSMDEARKGFLSRLSALAKAQSLFEGEGSVSLYDLVAREATAFGEQLKAGGPDVLLANHAAQSFSLIIHELATNAAKHGALSMPGGKVVVEWKIEGDRFSLAWIESDGPLVASPHRRGFGQSILHDIARNMTAECAASYPPEGFQYRLEVRLSAVGRAVANERVA